MTFACNSAFNKVKKQLKSQPAFAGPSVVLNAKKMYFNAITGIQDTYKFIVRILLR